MNSLIVFLRLELTNWKKIEIVWLGVATVTIFALSLYWKDSAIGIISAICGVLCVVLTGKGKRSSYIFGLVNTLLYAYIAFGAKYYGEVMLNLIYYLPMTFIGWFSWKKHINSSTGEVEKKRLPRKSAILIFFATGIAFAFYGMLLKYLKGNLPFVDSMSTIVAIAAQILCVNRYMEQWILWIIVNIVTIIMWIFAFKNGGESIATLLMWSVFLVNAIIMCIKWNREAKL